MLQSNVKGVQKGYPLGIRATKLNVLDVPFNKEFVKSVLSRLDYAVLRMAARAVRTLTSWSSTATSTDTITSLLHFSHLFSKFFLSWCFRPFSMKTSACVPGRLSRLWLLDLSLPPLAFWALLVQGHNFPPCPFQKSRPSPTSYSSALRYGYEKLLTLIVARL